MNYLIMKLGKAGSLALGAVLATGLVVSGAMLAKRTEVVTLPEGTALHVRLDHAVSSNQSRAGDEFSATVSAPVVIEEQTVIPAGAAVKGRVTDAKESGRLRGVPRLQLALTEMQVGDTWYEVSTTSAVRVGRNHNKRNWGWIGGGAAGGTVLGAIAAGGKGALIGGPIGAGAGVTAAYLTGKRDIRLPAETPLTFRLAQPVAVEPVTGEVEKIS